MRKLALALGFLAILTAADPASALSLGGIRNQLIDWLLSKVSVEGIFEISVDEVTDAEGQEGTTLRGLQIADSQGTWFTAEALTFDWNRSRLLRGQLVINTLQAQGVEFMREPVIPPGEQIEVDLQDVDKPPEPFIWPRSPISAEIRNLVLQNVHLHEPVLGQEISFNATGSFRDIGDVQAASLELQRTDQIAGSIDFAYTNDFAANTLKVDLDAAEDAGGLVSALAGLPADVPVALTLNADGTPGDYNLAFNLAMTDYLQAQGTAKLDYEGPIQINADISARPGPKMPPEAAQVLGDEAELVIQAAEGDDQLIEIETARLSSPYLRASATGTYARATGAADLQVDLTAEPELAAPFEGVEFAGLAFNGTIQGQPGSLTANGDLTLDGFATATAAVDQATLNIDVGQSGTAEAPTTNLSVQGNVQGLRLDQIPAEVIGDARLAVDASMTGSEVTLRTAEIDSQALTVSASGTANTETGNFDVSYQASAPQIGPVLEPYGVEAKGTIAAQGQAASEDGVLSLQTSADLTDFQYPQLAAQRLHVEANAVQYAERTTFDVTGNGQALQIDQLGPDLLDQADFAASGILEGTTLRLGQARLTSPVLEATAEGTVQTDGTGGELRYDIRSQQIGPVAQAYGVDAQGSVSATGTVELAPDGATVTTDANLTDFRSEFADAGRLNLEGTVGQQGEQITFYLTGGGERLRIDQIGPDLLGQADFVARGALDGQQLTLDQARLTSPLLNASAEGSLNLETSEGRIRYDVGSVALGPVAELYEVPVTGTAAAEGTVELVSTDGTPVPQITGQATVDDLSYDGTDIGDVALQHDVTLSQTPNGTLALRLTEGEFAPAAVQTRFRLEDQRLALNGLDLRALGLTASGDLAVNLETTLAEGTLEIGAADLSRLPGAAVAGRANGRLRLAVENGRQNASLALAARSLTAGGVAIGAARVDAQIRDALGTPAVDAEIAAERIVSGGLTLATVTATAKGPLSALQIALQGEGDLDGKPLALATAARADVSGETMRATVSQLDLALAEDRVSLLEPLRLVSSGGTIRIDNLALALPDSGRLIGEVAYFGGPLAGNIQLDMPDISILARLAGAPVKSGALEVAAEFDTRSGRANADVAVTGREIVFADISGAGVLGLEATLDWNGRVADLDARVTGSFGEPLVVTAALPVVASGGIPTLAERGPVSGQIRWNGEIGELWALVPAPGVVVTGEAAVDIGITGDISDPRFTGGVLLADGTVQYLDTGTILTGVSLATEIDETGALAIRLEGTDGANGTLRVVGTVGLGDEGVDLRIESRRAVLVRRDDVAARIGLDLHIFGPLNQLAIVGDVRIVEAEVRLVNANPPGIVTLGDVRIKGEPLPDEGNGEPALPIRLQIDVTSPGNEIFVRGRGLDSQWQTDLQIRGDASQPVITGEVSAVRGTLDLIGKTFDLARGRVIFDGGRQIDPRLDVVLERQSSGITGRIIVSGFASDPQLSFASTPALPEDEVLPRVLFGTSSQGLSAAQGIQLAIGLATLLDGGGGTFEQLRNAVGVDTLSVEQDDEGDASLAIGEQIDENIWVGTKQSLTGEGGTSVAVEVDVFENVQVQGEAGSAGNSSVGVQWRKDF